MRRVIAIISALVALLGGLGYYFVGVYMPARRLRFARDEIAKWEMRFDEARTCVLGKTPASSKTREALAVREMSPDPWDRKSCTAMMGKLARGEGPESGIPAIERAWQGVDTAASKAAQAFAAHLDPSTTGTADPLPDALDELDTARVALRAAASLTTVDTAGRALPAAQLIPIRDGAEPLVSLEVDAIPSAHGIVVFGATAGHGVQVTLVPGGAPAVTRVTAGEVRAVPDASWAALARGPGAVAGSADPDGAIAAPLVLDPLPPSKSDDAPATIAAAIGTAADGIVVYGGTARLAIAHVHAGKATTTTAQIDQAVAGTDLDGRAVVVWSEGMANPAHARLLAPGADDASIELPPQQVSPPCLSRDRAWVVADDAIVGFGRGGRVDGTLDSGELVGCTSEGAIARSLHERRALAVCTTACRTLEMPSNAPDESTLALVGGKVVAMTEHGGVLGAWREDGTSAFYALPAGAHPASTPTWAAMALCDGKSIDVLVQLDHGFAVARVPVTATK